MVRRQRHCDKARPNLHVYAMNEIAKHDAFSRSLLLRLFESDEVHLSRVKRMYGLKHASAAIRLALRILANSKMVVLDEERDDPRPQPER